MSEFELVQCRSRGSLKACWESLPFFSGIKRRAGGLSDLRRRKNNSVSSAGFSVQTRDWMFLTAAADYMKGDEKAATFLKKSSEGDLACPGQDSAPCSWLVVQCFTLAERGSKPPVGGPMLERFRGG